MRFSPIYSGTFRVAKSINSAMVYAYFEIGKLIVENEQRGDYLRHDRCGEPARQVDSLLFERLALSRDKKEVKTLAEKGQILEKPGNLTLKVFDLRIINYLGNELPDRVRNCICDVLIELFWNFKLVEIQGKQVDQNRLYHSELKAFRLTSLGQKVLSIVTPPPSRQVS
ncbi:MAG: hypothetical protein ABIH69_03390 [bacterium]|nr:hypothetical protein [Candidatus Margulisiibacteriota bacterium]